jgi:hypothetical protein
MVVEAGWQAAALQDLIRLLQPQEAVRALVLFGTTAQAQVPAQWLMDVWSDIDLLLVVAEGMLAQFHPAMDWLKPLGELYTWDQSSHPFASTTRVCFTDFRRVDFVITTEAGLEQVDQWPLVAFWKGTRTLFSRSPRVDRVLARTFERPKPRLIPPDEFQAMVNGFWFKGVLAVTKVMRNDLLIALHLALEMVQDCCVLGMLLRDRTEGTAHHRHGGAGNDVVAQLEATRCSYTASGILDSLEQSSAAFDELAAQWSDAYQEHRHPLQSWITFARLGLTGEQSESYRPTEQPR